MSISTDFGAVRS